MTGSKGKSIGAAGGMLCALLVLASSGRASATSDRGELGDRNDLLQFLNSDHPSHQPIMVGSCLMSVNHKTDLPTWIYVILPSASPKGYLAQLVPDEPRSPIWTNMGDLYVLKRSVSLSDNFGGEATLAMLEGSGWWILQHHLTKANTYAQALAKPPSLRCPTGPTMIAWRYGHRRRSVAHPQRR